MDVRFNSWKNQQDEITLLFSLACWKLFNIKHQFEVHFTSTTLIMHKTNSNKHLYRFNLTNHCNLTKVIKSTIHISQVVFLFSQDDKVLYIIFVVAKFHILSSSKNKMKIICCKFLILNKIQSTFFWRIFFKKVSSHLHWGFSFEAVSRLFSIAWRFLVATN